MRKIKFRRQKRLITKVIKEEKKLVSSKTLLMDTRVGKKLRWKISNNFYYLGIKSKLKAVCIFSGQSKSIDTFTRLGRIELRNNAMNGLLPGIKKSSW